MTHKPNQKFTGVTLMLGRVEGFEVTHNTVDGYKARGRCPVCDADDQGGSEFNPEVDIWVSSGTVEGGGGGDGGADSGLDAPQEGGGGGAEVELRVEALRVSCRCACGAAHGVEGKRSCGATWFVEEARVEWRSE